MGAMTEQYKRINDILDEAEGLMVETGLYDTQTARALFAGIRPPGTDNIVGNIADLQRQPFMPPGFEQGAMDGANPIVQVAPGSDAPVTARTEAQKLEEYGATVPESPATSDEALERMSTPAGGGPTVVPGDVTEPDSSSAETPQTGEQTGETSEQTSENPNLEGMTKADLQTYADSRNIQVDSGNMTKDEMIAAIRDGGV